MKALDESLVLECRDQVRSKSTPKVMPSEETEDSFDDESSSPQRDRKSGPDISKIQLKASELISYQDAASEDQRSVEISEVSDDSPPVEDEFDDESLSPQRDRSSENRSKSGPHISKIQLKASELISYQDAASEDERSVEISEVSDDSPPVEDEFDDESLSPQRDRTSAYRSKSGPHISKVQLKASEQISYQAVASEDETSVHSPKQNSKVHDEASFLDMFSEDFDLESEGLKNWNKGWREELRPLSPSKAPCDDEYADDPLAAFAACVSRYTPTGIFASEDHSGSKVDSGSEVILPANEPLAYEAEDASILRFLSKMPRTACEVTLKEKTASDSEVSKVSDDNPLSAEQIAAINCPQLADIRTVVFSCLPIRDRASLRSTCKRWNNELIVTEKELLIKYLLRHLGPGESLFHVFEVEKESDRQVSELHTKCAQFMEEFGGLAPCWTRETIPWLLLVPSRSL